MEFTGSGGNAKGVTIKGALESRACAAFATFALLGVLLVGVPVKASAATLSWSQTPSPLVAPNGYNPYGSRSYLRSVSCVSTKFCVATGSYGGGFDGAATTQGDEWDGRRWILSPGLALVDALGAVSCANRTSCVALGSFAGIPSALTFNGTSWSTTPLPGGGQLNGLSCSSARNCVAVGSTSDATPKELVETWNGTSWSVAATSANLSGLATISCIQRSTFCMAVGNGSVQSLTETKRGGTWAVTLGTAIAAPSGTLSAVSCKSAKFCMAVGTEPRADFYTQGLAELWNGKTWVNVPYPPTSSISSAGLVDVSCPSTKSCIATGTSNCSPCGNGALQGTINYWNGASWSEVYRGYGLIDGVSCATVKFCFAVGGSSYIPNGQYAIRGAA